MDIVLILTFLILLVLLVVGIGIVCYILEHAFDDTAKKSDVIIVLGALTNIQGTNSLNSCLTSRVNHGISLLKQGMSGKILFTGGKTKGDKENEYALMEDLALIQHVTSKQILLEKQAQSTYENFVFSKTIMEKNHLKTAIIVTDPYHNPRAVLVAKKLHMSVTSSPATESPCSRIFPSNMKLLFSEILAMIRYKFMEKI